MQKLIKPTNEYQVYTIGELMELKKIKESELEAIKKKLRQLVYKSRQEEKTVGMMALKEKYLMWKKYPTAMEITSLLTARMDITVG